MDGPGAGLRRRRPGPWHRDTMMVRVDLLGIASILGIVIGIIAGWPAQVVQVFLHCETNGDSTIIGLDVVTIFWATPGTFHYRRFSGLTIGDTIFIDSMYRETPYLVSHELNHVAQFQALGLFYPLGALIFNLEGMPFYSLNELDKCNSHMWLPPPGWPYSWHLISFMLR